MESKLKEIAENKDILAINDEWHKLVSTITARLNYKKLNDEFIRLRNSCEKFIPKPSEQLQAQMIKDDLSILRSQ